MDHIVDLSVLEESDDLNPTSYMHTNLYSEDIHTPEVFGSGDDLPLDRVNSNLASTDRQTNPSFLPPGPSVHSGDLVGHVPRGRGLKEYYFETPRSEMNLVAGYKRKRSNLYG